MSVNSMSAHAARSNAVVSNRVLRALLRLALPAVAITLALAVEVSMVPRLHLPHAGPDLVLLVVLGFAAVWGAAGGAGVGFAAGLALDLAPPSVGAIGRHAFVLVLVGALAGRAARELRNSALRTCLLAGLYAAGAVLVNACLGTLLGDGTGLGRVGLLVSAGAAALYTAVATPLVVPGIAALARRTASPGARVLAPAGNALGAVAFEAVAFESAVTFTGPAGDLARSRLAQGDPALYDGAGHDGFGHDGLGHDLSPRGTRRAFQHPEAG